MNRGVIALILICLSSFIVSGRASAIAIDTVPVGNAGNANDPATGNLYGGVDYNYRMGKYEVTVGQYTAYLNAVAGTDTYKLYNRFMASDPNIAGIAQNGSAGSYTSSTIGSPNRPIACISWGDAARFSNWLNNGQPSGEQTAATTEDDAYTLNGALTSAAINAVTRNAGAKWFIPTENEWYKAAYHENDGPTNHYWKYPTGTNEEPSSDQPPGDTSIQTNAGNFYRDDGLANGYNDGDAVTGSASFLPATQNHLTDGGAYVFSPSPYGTFDQGGNLWEYNEALISGTFRGLRGGSWISNGFPDASAFMLASDREFNDPQFADVDGVSLSGVGFRVATVASVPEAGSKVLAISGCTILFWGWKWFS